MTSQRSRLSLALAVAAAIGASLVAPGSASAVTRDFFGVQADTGSEPMSGDDFNRMADARSGTLRLSFDWNRVQGSEGGDYDWTFYDETMRRAARAGVNVLSVLAGSPSFAAERPSYPPMSEPGRAAYRAFVGAVVRRYGNNGSFWAENPDVPYTPIRSHQVWNEPNLKSWWNGRPSARQYGAFLRYVVPEIRAADPGAEVVLAGLPESRLGIRMTTYLKSLYRSSRSIRSYFDVVAIHPYARDHRGVEGALIRIRRLMNENRDRRTKIWITESGWATHGDFPSNAWTTSEETQAKRMRDTWRMLVRRRSRYRIRGVVWYNWRDLSPGGGSPDWWGNHCGLFRLDGSAKPVWDVYRSFTSATS